MTADNNDRGRRARVRRTTILLGLIALGFYAAFIIAQYLRATA